MRNFILFVIAAIFCTTTLQAQYAIGHRSFSFTDPARANRVVTGEAYYPATIAGDNTPFVVGEFPLLVFGHGFLMPWSEYSVWWEHLVPNGYIMVFPRTEGGFSPNHGNFGGDLSFLVTKFNLEDNTVNSPYYQHLSGKNAVMGHSMGGGCSYLAGPQNTAIHTLLTFAAAETNPSAIAAAANSTIPTLTVAGSADCVVTANGGPDDIYAALPNTHYKSFINITGASHCNFGINTPFAACDLGETCNSGIPKATQHTLMFQATDPWLAYFLKNDCPAWNTFYTHLTTSNTHTYLQGGPLPLATPVITQSGNVLTATGTGTYTYKWYRDNILISGAYSMTYTMTQTGTYKVEITNNVPCTATSANFVVTVLPLELLDFNVVAINGSELVWNWVTTQEKNTSHFDVQISKNGIDYQTLTTISAKNEITQCNYQWSGLVPSNAVLFCRLKINDLDGQYQYSPVRNVRFAQKDVLVKILNNPSRNHLRIWMDAVTETTTTVHLWDMTGRLILSHEVTVQKGDQVIDWPKTDELGHGVYFLNMEDNHMIKWIKI